MPPTPLNQPLDPGLTSGAPAQENTATPRVAPAIPRAPGAGALSSGMPPLQMIAQGIRQARLDGASTQQKASAKVESSRTPKAPIPASPQSFSVPLAANQTAQSLQQRMAAPARPPAYTPRPEHSPAAQAPQQAKRKKTITPTDEQAAIHACRDPLVVADAFAGCGKTTACEGWAQARPNWSILYLTLNAANAAEARARFDGNVKAATTHAMARQFIKPEPHRVTDRWKPMLLQDALSLRSPREAAAAQKVLAQFFNSGDASITDRHARLVIEQGAMDMTPVEAANAVSAAKLAWLRMNRKGDSMPMPHDAYLKMFALQAPQLPYDAVIFDEAQDANPVTLQILRGQKSLRQMLCIGDRHQSIYAFRGSVNAMQELSKDATRMSLTKTWRFGPDIADLANTILGELKGETKKIQGLGQGGATNAAHHIAHLARTNAGLFKVAAEVRGQGVHWVTAAGQPSESRQAFEDRISRSYRLDLVLDAYYLWSKQRQHVKDDLMRRKFASWDDYARYAEDAQDAEARIMVKAVEEYQDGTPDLLNDILVNAVQDESKADMTLTTAHKSKGLEWNSVRIGEDFEVLEKSEAALRENDFAKFPEQDVNLLYVAVTRAQKQTMLNKETQQWLEMLPRHRQDRQAAQQRQAADLDALRQLMRP